MQPPLKLGTYLHKYILLQRLFIPYQNLQTMIQSIVRYALQNCGRSDTFFHQLNTQCIKFVQIKIQKSEENPLKTQYVNTPRKFKSLSFVVMVERSQYSWTYSCQNDSCRMKYSGILQYPKMFWENVKNICYKCFIYTRIFGAYGPIMFALQVWEGFRASWRGGPLSENCSFLSIPT